MNCQIHTMSRLLNSSVFLNLFRVLLPKHKRQMCNVVLNTNIRPASKVFRNLHEQESVEKVKYFRIIFQKRYMAADIQ